MSSPPPSAQFLAGSILVSTPMLQDWLFVLDYLVPMTTGPLNAQLTNCQSQLALLLAATPNPALETGKTILPITLVSEIQFALATYEYQFHGFNSQSYFDMVDNVNSVYNQYSIAFYNSNSTKPFVVY